MVDFLDINGARLAYRIVGEGPLFITLHGGRGMGDRKSDFKAFSPLADRFRILSFDFRGHGESSETKPYTFEQIVDDIEGLRQRFVGPTEQVIICGGSFGGFIAQQYAIKYSPFVSHLILRGTAPSYHHEDDAVKILEQRLFKAPCMSVSMLKNKVFGRYESDVEFRLIMFTLSPLYSESFHPENALQKNLSTVFRAETHGELYSKKEKCFDYRDRMHEVHAKTLVIVGAKDWICPPKQAKIIADGIPSATLLIVEGANHSVHVEKNALVLEAIRKHTESGCA